MLQIRVDGCHRRFACALARVQYGFAAALLLGLAVSVSAQAEDIGDWAGVTGNPGPATGPGGTAPHAGHPAKTNTPRSNLGGPKSALAVAPKADQAPLSGLLVSWQARSDCVPAQFRQVLAEIVASFGPVTVTSTCRSTAQNQTAGGAGHSYHLLGQAVDFRVSGQTTAIYANLARNPNVGGLKHYGGGLFHIDTGPRRSW